MGSSPIVSTDGDLVEPAAVSESDFPALTFILAPPWPAAISRVDTFESMESFQEAFGTAAPALVGDVPNFTNTQPTIQISEVKL